MVFFEYSEWNSEFEESFNAHNPDLSRRPTLELLDAFAGYNFFGVLPAYDLSEHVNHR